MDFNFIYIKRSAIKFGITLQGHILHFLKTLMDFYIKFEFCPRSAHLRKIQILSRFAPVIKRIVLNSTFISKQ